MTKWKKGKTGKKERRKTLRSDCRQSYRQCIELQGESGERGREPPFGVQSMLIQEYF